MDLLTLVRLFLILGNICYILAILTFVKRHLPKIQIRDNKKETEVKEDGRKEE